MSTPKGYKIADSTQESAILNKYNSDGRATSDDGAIYIDNSYNLINETSSTSGQADRIRTFTFDASRSSSTYQDNAPVQANAYLINVFERIA